jgi:hypothetical protein
LEGGGRLAPARAVVTFAAGPSGFRGVRVGPSV